MHPRQMLELEGTSVVFDIPVSACSLPFLTSLLTPARLNPNILAKQLKKRRHVVLIVPPANVNGEEAMAISA